jgi:uncharacterized protein YbaP (TraB family)
MKLRNAGLLLVVLAATAACKKAEQRVVAPVTQGGSADPWSASEPKKDPLQKPLLWQIEKDGTTSFLLGTMHMGVDPTTRLPDIVWKKLDEKPIFAMETDLAGADQLDILRKDGTTLKDELGAEYWKKLEDALGVDEAAQLIKMKPMIPATLLSMRGLPRTPPMDGVLHGRAQNGKKQVVFLEKLEAQSKVLEKWMNARALKDMLDDLPRGEKVAKDMLAAYLSGDEAKIQAIQDGERAQWVAKGRPIAEYEEQMDDLLYKRNASWIEPIEKLHAEGGGFIAVGAAHAIGPKNVLELLEKKGFKIARVTL